MVTLLGHPVCQDSRCLVAYSPSSPQPSVTHHRQQQVNIAVNNWRQAWTTNGHHNVKPKFHLARHVLSLLDTTRHVRCVEPMHFCCRACWTAPLDTLVTSQVEFGLYMTWRRAALQVTETILYCCSVRTVPTYDRGKVPELYGTLRTLHFTGQSVGTVEQGLQHTTRSRTSCIVWIVSAQRSW